jgi:glycerol kinase
VVEAMEKDSGVSLSILRVDGGMTSNDLLMQFQADILNTSVVRPRVAETTSLGAAYAAGLAVGFWKNVDELRENWSREKEWTPQMPENERDKMYRDWKRAVTRTFDWIE